MGLEAEMMITDLMMIGKPKSHAGADQALGRIE
jgi:hypothetical protein